MVFNNLTTVGDFENGIELINTYKFSSTLIAKEEKVNSWLQYCKDNNLIYCNYRSHYLVDYNFYSNFKPVSLTGNYWDYVKDKLHPEETKAYEMHNVANKIGIFDHALELRTIFDNIPVLICAPYEYGFRDYNPVHGYTMYELDPSMITYYAFIEDGEFNNGGTNYLLVESKYIDYLESREGVMSFIKPDSKVSF